MKKWLLLIIFLLIGSYVSAGNMGGGIVSISGVVSVTEGKDTTEWTLTDYDAADTDLMITKAASSGHTWMVTDISGGADQNGWLIIEINDVEVWRMRFPANGTVGQKVNLSAATNQKIEAIISTSSSSACSVNMRGVDIE